MGSKFVSACNLGYAVLFITLWVKYMGWAGWLTTADMQSSTGGLMLIFGAVLAIAGIFSLFNEDKIEAVLFLITTAYVAGFAVRYWTSPNLAANTNPAGVDGWFHFLICVVVLCLWLTSFSGGFFRQLFLLCLWLAELAGAIGNWTGTTGSNLFLVIGGYLGLGAGLFAGLYYYSIVVKKREAAAA